MDKRQQIIDAIDNMDIDDQYALFCQYCEDANCMDDMPESSYEIDDIWSGCKPSELLDKMDGYSSTWDYYCFDGYGNVQEWEGIEYIDDVVDYIIDNNDALDNSDIQDILDDDETEEN